MLDAFAQESVGIINLDAHLDLRQTDRATSGTPFRQLAQLCDAQSRAFHYACFGVSRAANTQALWREAQWRNVTVVEDLDCHDALAQMAQFIDKVDKIYLTIDLDVLPVWEMPAVSAPAALGVPLIQVLRLIEPVCRSGKLQAADLVEFNPRFDEDGAAARVAARRLANRALVALICHPENIIRIRKASRMYSSRSRSAPAPFYETVKQDICKK